LVKMIMVEVHPEFSIVPKPVKNKKMRD